jgi:hypothetical protein
VDQRVHGDHVIELAEFQGRHVADTKIDAPSPICEGRRSRASSISVGDRSTATTRRRAARLPRPGHAGAAAGVEQALAAQVVRQPVQQQVAHLVAPGAHGLADAADRRVGGQRDQASAAVRSK